MKILFPIIPGSGHLHPIVPMARGLVHRGHDVRIATAAAFAPAVRAAGLEPVSVGPDWDGTDPTASDPQFVSRPSLEQLNWLIGMTAPGMAADIVAMAATWLPDLIIRDNLAFGGWAAGEELGIPVVVFGVTGVMPVPVAQMILGERLAELRASRNLPPDPELTGLSGLAYLDPAPPSLEDPFASLVAGRLPIRPSTWAGDGGSAPDWLSALGSRPVVYVTLGTVVNGTVDVFQKIAQAAAGLDVDVVMTIGRNGNPATLGNLAENIHVARYIPQDAVLSIASAAVCHAGRGTVNGALAAGVPLVLIPLGTDQPLVAAACQRAGAGVVCATTTTSMGPTQAPLAVAADLTPAAIRVALERVLSEPGLRQRAREVAAEIAEMPSAEDVAESLEAMVSEADLPSDRRGLRSLSMGLKEL
jgi:UDP:flavonoid glycosyltransferase YjiC (YdhE family)